MLRIILNMNIMLCATHLYITILINNIH